MKKVRIKFLHVLHFNKMKKGFDKKGMEMQMMGWWIIAIAVLIIMLVGFFILKDKGINAIEYVRNILRFRG